MVVFYYVLLVGFYGCYVSVAYIELMVPLGSNYLLNM